MDAATRARLQEGHLGPSKANQQILGEPPLNGSISYSLADSDPMTPATNPDVDKPLKEENGTSLAARIAHKTNRPWLSPPRHFPCSALQIDQSTTTAAAAVASLSSYLYTPCSLVCCLVSLEDWSRDAVVCRRGWGLGMMRKRPRLLVRVGDASHRAL
jgi:hypothetical protein